MDRIRPLFLTIRFCLLLGAICIYLYQSSFDVNAANMYNNKEDRFEVVSMSNLEKISIAIRKYADDHRGNFPPSLEELYPKYISVLNIFEHPAIHRKILDKKEIPQKTGYEYIVGKGKFRSFNIISLYEKYESRPGGKYVLFGDGHIEWKSNDELSILLSRQTSFVLIAVTSSGPMAMFKNLKTGKTYVIKEGEAFEDYAVTDITRQFVIIQRKSDSKKSKLTMGELLRFEEDDDEDND